MNMFRVQNSGYDSPRKTLRVVEKDPNLGKKAAETVQPMTLIDTLLIKRHPIIRGRGSIINCEILSLI